MTFQSAPIPAADPIAITEFQKQSLNGFVGQRWVEYLTDLSTTIASTARRLASVELLVQSASIGATDLGGGTLGAGLYRVMYYARITQAASTSSSLEITFSWTDGGVSPSSTGAAMTGNSTSTFQSGTLMVNVDSITPLTYATTYGSVGGTPMQYSLYLVLEEMSLA